MRSEHLLDLPEVKKPLGPSKCLCQIIRMDVVVSDVAKANVASCLHKAITFLCWMVPSSHKGKPKIEMGELPQAFCCKIDTVASLLT